MSTTRSIARRQPKKPGADLVPSEDIEPLCVQIQRLLRHFEGCDDGARIEVLRVAELLSAAR